MNKRLVIIGASGHGKVVADIALKLQQYEEIVFLDDNENVKECMDFSVVGRSAEAVQYIDTADFIVAIGNAKIRKKVMKQLLEMDATITTLIHPTAVVGNHSTIEKGTVVMAGAIINPDSVIGQGCIINTCASVDHDCRLGDYVHVSVGTHVCGTVVIGDNTWVGAGATICNNLNVCGDCMIGAGAVVVKDINVVGTYVGVPVRRIKVDENTDFGK